MHFLCVVFRFWIHLLASHGPFRPFRGSVGEAEAALLGEPEAGGAWSGGTRSTLCSHQTAWQLFALQQLRHTVAPLAKQDTDRTRSEFWVGANRSNWNQNLPRDLCLWWALWARTKNCSFSRLNFPPTPKNTDEKADMIPQWGPINKGWTRLQNDQEWKKISTLLPCINNTVPLFLPPKLWERRKGQKGREPQKLIHTWPTWEH